MRRVEGLKICYKCDYETGDDLAQCPRCNHTLRSARQVRRLGWVLAVTGAFLMIFMTGLIILIAYIMAQTGKPGSTTSFSGTRTEAVMIFGILGIVWAFGLTSLAGGIWQVRHGRRNKGLTATILWLGAAFLVIGLLIELFD